MTGVQTCALPISEVKNYLLEENAYTEHHLKDTKDLQKKLFNEIKGRIKLNDLYRISKEILFDPAAKNRGIYNFIKIENLFKEYKLGVIGHSTLYRELQSWWSTVRGKEDPNALIGHSTNGRAQDKILALNNINLEVNKGEVLGIEVIEEDRKSVV